jgi:dienelactone hydrolase
VKIRILSIVARAAAGLLTGSGHGAPTTPDGVTVQDIHIEVPGQQPMSAYLVRPAGRPVPRSLAGVLYLHWLEPGALNQNRTEFLAEAVTQAGRGAVAILPDLVFPWNGDVLGTAQDAASVRAQLAAVTKAYQALLAQPGVDPRRTGVVGHDYGAMYGALLSQRAPVRAEVYMAGDATWSNWFAKYFLQVPETPQYQAVFAGLDPVDNVRRIGAHLYLQWAGDDFFIPSAVRDRFAAADPAATVSVYDGDDHSLDDQSVYTDRVAWLEDQLGLA